MCSGSLQNNLTSKWKYSVGGRVVSPWPLLWRYVLPLRVTVQMCTEEIWWITCCCTVCWSLCLSHCSTHVNTHSLRPWYPGASRLSVISSSLLVHQHDQTTCTGCASVTQVAVLQRFIPLQCRRCVESHPEKCHCKSPVMKQQSFFLLQTWRVLQLSILSLPLVALPLLQSHYKNTRALCGYKIQDLYWQLPQLKYCFRKETGWLFSNESKLRAKTSGCLAFSPRVISR